MSGTCRIILIQPPFVQLNSPYPAPYYLKSFMETRSRDVTVLDHSIGLFERIFSRSGLERIFADASCSRAINKNAALVTERFISEKEIWLASIDRLVAFLRGKDYEWGHFLALANGCCPGGPRVDAYLAEKDGDVSPDESKLLATMLLSDLADFIACTLDSGFGLVKYTPVLEASLNSGFRDFAIIQKSLRENASVGYIMDSFYRPLLREEWSKLETEELVLLGLTVPFPGCLVPALICAESAKKHFGDRIRTVVGGGYVNTELRFLNVPEFFDYFDYVSFDKGYGSLVSVLEHLEGEKSARQFISGASIYKTIYRFQGSIVAPPDLHEKPNNIAALEDESAKTTFPDYSAVDFDRYLCPVDDTNSMHRLWSDGHWLKAYLAHGCYWHSCAFCDVTLDYIQNFIPVDTPALFTHLKSQAEKTGVRGIHFCDEAAPVSSLLEFAVLNRAAGLPLSFWGNIRFEKGFDSDTAAILAAGGLIGVSAGLEVVSESGFKRLGKGIDLEGTVRACAALKEAGILTHAYLIYGYWDEDEEELINSAETLRQFFAQELLDSAFWHKFILTRHSRLYAEKQRGLHPGLGVKDDSNGGGKKIFALNDLSFEGEEKFGKYSSGLELLLKAFMAGKTESPVAEAFTFRVKAPAVSADLVELLLDQYARNRDLERTMLPVTEDSAADGTCKNVLFLGSIPMPGRKGKERSLFWRWRLDERELKTGGKKPDGIEAEKLAVLLESASYGRGLNAAEFYSSLEEISGRVRAKRIWEYLRGNGLAVYWVPYFSSTNKNSLL
jgi:hypothetical protein